MTGQGEYICLRETFISTAQFYINENVLITLKEHYAQVINSNRKLCQIKDLRTLLKVLEKRDTLNHNDIGPLHYISNNFLTDLEIQRKIKIYQDNIDNKQYPQLHNMYENSKENDSENKATVCNETQCESNSQAGIGHGRNLSQQELMLQQILLTRISERIGRSWRDTVRYLGVPEYQVDEIQNKYALDLKEQSYQALKLYVSQYSNNNWKINLLRALEKARRRDLKELVEELIIGLST